MSEIIVTPQENIILVSVADVPTIINVVGVGPQGPQGIPGSGGSGGEFTGTILGSNVIWHDRIHGLYYKMHLVGGEWMKELYEAGSEAGSQLDIDFVLDTSPLG